MGEQMDKERILEVLEASRSAIIEEMNAVDFKQPGGRFKFDYLKMKMRQVNEQMLELKGIRF